MARHWPTVVIGSIVLLHQILESNGASIPAAPQTIVALCTEHAHAPIMRA